MPMYPFGQDLYLCEGPIVSFFGAPYPTRMAVIRLSSGDLWVWSPIALTPELTRSIIAMGRVAHIVSPNKLHHLFLPAWHQQWPNARLYAPPGLVKKLKHLHFEATLSDIPEEPWRGDIDQTIFRGSPFLVEVAFFHRLSRTAIFGDLIQRFPESTVSGWMGMMLRLGGVVGPRGTTPIDWRLSFLSRSAARAARQKVLSWKPERLVIAHGDCAERDAEQVIASALRWV